ncbi:family 43 glycosylhydrolase, partial [Ligaoa zhengdingensis]
MAKKNLLSRVVSVVLSVAMACSPLTAYAQTAGTGAAEDPIFNYNFNQGELEEAPFAQLPMGAVQAEDWLLQQLYLQKNGLTGYIHNNLAIYSEASAWRGGSGDNWEKGPYYLRGLTSLAWVLDDDELKAKAQEWIDALLATQRFDGFFGPESNTDWWPRMVMVQILRDYYEATVYAGEPDERIIDFLEKYFRYQQEQKPQLSSWGSARGGDNIEVVLWYYNHIYDPANPEASEWLIDLANTLYATTYNWTDVFTDTTVRQHVVNTTQGMKTPAVIYQITGSQRDRNALREGLFNLGIDHGRVDSLANADELARENYPYRGTETCSVVESILSDAISMRILGEGWLGDELEHLAYNSLPVCYSPDFTGHNYYQAQNQVLATHGSHESLQEYGDSFAFSAPSGYECCFPNMHMGWPKFVQNMWMATVDGGMAVISYGPNSVTAPVAGGKTAEFRQETNYPFNGDISITYGGDTASFPLKLRIPEWCEAPSFQVNGTAVGGDVVNGFLTIEREWKAGDVVEAQFPMEVRTSTWYNNSVVVDRGPLTYSVKVEEDWRVVENPNDTRSGNSYPQLDERFPNHEVYAASEWNYGLVIDPDDPASSFTVEVADEIPLQPFTVQNAPVKIKVTGQTIPQWEVMGNVVPEPPYSPIAADTSLQKEIELIPYGCGRLRITQIPTIGEAPAGGVTTRTVATATTKTQDGEKVVEFDNVMVRNADSYTLKIHYTGSGSLRMNINTKYNQTINFAEGGDPIVVENLQNIVPGGGYFRFDYGQYNNIRFFGDDAVEITELEIIPTGLVEKPEILSAKSNANGTGVTIKTNVTRDDAFFTVDYGTESGVYTTHASGFRSETAAITGLENGKTYYFRVGALLGGVETYSEEVAVLVKSSEASKPNFVGDFSDDANKADWTVYDPNNAVKFEDGEMKVSASTDIRMGAGEEAWTDYAVEATISGEANPSNNFGIMFRATGITGKGPDAYNGYYAGIGYSYAAKGYALCVGYADGGWHDIGYVPVDYQAGKDYNLKVLVAGSKFAVYLDGELKYEHEDARFANGLAGVRSYNVPFNVSAFEIRELTDDEMISLGKDPAIFKDDFSDPTASAAKWKLYDPNNAVSFEAGKMAVSPSQNLKILAQTDALTDFAAEAKVSGPANPVNNFGIMFRCNNVTDTNGDSYQGYYAGIGYDTQSREYGLIVGKSNNAWGRITSVADVGYEAGKVYDLKVLAKGGEFIIFVDGVERYRFEDASYASGTIGLRSWNQAFDTTAFEVRNLTADELALFEEEEEPIVPEVANFADDFEDATASAAKWRLCGDKSSMNFADGKLAFAASTNVKAVAGSENWTDYVAEVTLNLQSARSNNVGLMYRVTDVSENGSDNYYGYYVGIGKSGTSCMILGYGANGWHQMKTIPHEFEVGVDYRIKVVLSGDRIAIYLDDNLMSVFYDDLYDHGMIGLRGYGEAFTADDIVVRPVTDEDLKVFDGLKRYVDSGYSAYGIAQLKFSRFGGADGYKMVSGTESGNYTKEVYELIAHTTSLTKTAISGLENGKPHYLRIASVSGGVQTGISDEIVVTPGEREDISEELASLSALTETSRAIANEGYTEASWYRLQWAIENAEKVLASAGSNRMDVQLAENCLKIGANELEASTDEPDEYITVKYEAENATLTSPAAAVSRGDASGGKKVGTIDNGNATVTFTVYVPAAGEYAVNIAADGEVSAFPNPSHKYYVNGDTANAKIVNYDKATKWDVWTEYPLTVNLNAGLNTITFTHSGVNASFAELDYLTLTYVAPKLKSISVDGAALEGFDPAVKQYELVIDDEIPTVDAALAASSTSNYELEIIQATAATMEAKINILFPGTTQVADSYTVSFRYAEKVMEKLEAEDAVITLPAKVRDHAGASGGKKVGYIDNADATITFTLDAPAAGSYRIDIVSGSGSDQPNASQKYYVNGDADNAQIVEYEPNGWDNWGTYPVQVELEQGENTFTITHSGRTGSFSELDYIVFYTDYPEVTGITLDGESLDGFDANISDYEVDVESLDSLPVVGIDFDNEDYDVAIEQPTRESLTATITLSHKVDLTFSVTYTLKFFDEHAFTNPIVNFGADPYVTYHDGYYYYVRVHNDKAIYVFRSPELNRIASTQPYLVYSPSGDEPNQELWAPEIHYVDGCWYIYYTGGAGSNHRMYVLKSKTENPLEGFEFVGELAPETERWAIDQTILEHEGKLYAIWSGWDGFENVDQRIYIAEMSDPMTIVGDRVELSKPEYDWEKQGGTPHINEGAQVVKSPDGTVNILYSASGSWSDDYCLGQLTLKEGGDPMNAADWVKSEEAVFEKNPAVKTYSTGHACFVKSPDGTEDYMVYHATKESGQGWSGRGVRTQKFTWNEDGTPNLGEAIGYGSRVNLPSGTPIIERERYEAEDAALANGAAAESTYNSSNGKKVTGLGSEGASATFTVNAKEAGSYKLYLGAATGSADAGLAVSVNGGEAMEKPVVAFNAGKVNGMISDNWVGYELEIKLNEGENTIVVSKSAELTAAELDYIELELLKNEIPSDVDKAALKELVEAIDGKYEESGYTAESWAELEKALEEAKAVIAKADAEQT